MVQLYMRICVCLHIYIHTHIHIHSFYILSHYGLFLAAEYSSLCYAVGPCCLSDMVSFLTNTDGGNSPVVQRLGLSLLRPGSVPGQGTKIL